MMKCNSKNNLLDIGYKYVFEDVLAILSGDDDLQPWRHEFVLKDFSSLLQNAIRGMEISDTRSFFAGADKKKAFDTYLMFKRYFSDDLNWRDKVKLSKVALDHLQDGTEIPHDQREAVESVLGELFNRVRRKGVVPETPTKMAFY